MNFLSTLGMEKVLVEYSPPGMIPINIQIISHLSLSLSEFKIIENDELTFSTLRHLLIHILDITNSKDFAKSYDYGFL